MYGDDKPAEEPFDHSIEHVRASLGDEPKRDKSPHEVATYRQQDLLESLDSSVRKLEKRLRPVLRQSNRTTADGPTLARPGGQTAIANDNSSPVVQLLQTQNERAMSILAHLNNIIEDLEI
jgi:hypothetical protein